MEMLWIYLLIGLVTGFCSGLIGMGGGFILIPLLLLARVPMEAAISTSLVFVLFSATSGALRHGFQGTVDRRLAGSVAPVSVLTTFAGALLTVRFPASVLQSLLGVCVLAGLYLLNRKAPLQVVLTATDLPGRWTYDRTAEWGEESIHYRLDLKKAVGVGGVVGFLAGLLGVGGGFLMIPTFVGLMNIPLRVAIGTSLLTILASAFVGAVMHWGQGSMDLTVVWTTILTGVIGAQIGALCVPKMQEAGMKILMNVLLGLAAAYLFVLAGIGL